MTARIRGPRYAELQAMSNFSFLEGASHPEELVLQAATLGLDALGIADRNGVSGLVRGHQAAKAQGLKFLPGARLDLTDGISLLCYPTDRDAWGRLTELLTLGKRRTEKGGCDLALADLLAGDFQAGRGQLLIVLPPAQIDRYFNMILDKLKNEGEFDPFLAGQVRLDGCDAPRLAALAALAQRHGTPLVATNGVLMHTPRRRVLQDVLTCIREGCTLFEAGYRLQANAERHLKAPAEMARLFADHPAAVARTVEIAEACTFSLDELRYDYPIDPAPEGRTPQEELEVQTWAGAAGRYPGGIPDKVSAQIAHELALIGKLEFAPYFLTVFDIVRFARGRGILCQGRGSAANSAVCYALGITAVDPARLDLLFERFISAERGEPPDIDVDFENGRREEIIQYVYDKYGRARAAMTGTVITYRTKGAVRDAGKALGLAEDTIHALQGVLWRRSLGEELSDDRFRDYGLDAADPMVRRVLDLTRELRGFPRHLSQHSGGMVMTQGRLDRVVPIHNAAMEGRTVIEWDKNDLDTLGILKVDILALGMLTCAQKAFALLKSFHGREVTLATVPPEDPAVYDMLCKGDSVGVFQVESRAQMSMLPRLRPRDFYDLVIEVAIVRPGPIQGDMVHPYLRRRDGLEAVEFPSDELRSVLGKTLGVPLFQEQAMKIAIVAAGFTPSEADGLRRAMATFRNHGTIHAFREKFLAGMQARGYAPDFAERCFRQIEGFADYGFPESHAASFALIVYVSSWLKRHYPAAFACALLNSQPMGFYAPAQIVRDAREHGVVVRPVDVNLSDWDCTLEPGPASEPALRLGFRQVKGLREEDMQRLVLHRGNGYGDPATVMRRAGVGRPALEKLARADAFGSMKLDRRPALWAVKGLSDAPPPPLFALSPGDADPFPPEDAAEPLLPLMTPGEEVADDYRSLRLSLRAHPAEVLRPKLAAQRYAPCRNTLTTKHGRHVRIAGLVTARQRPGTAKGVIFLTIEDETATVNLIVWPHVFEAFRRPVLGSRLLGVTGEVQRAGAVVHVIVQAAEDLAEVLLTLDAPSDGGAEARRMFRAREFQ
ncbi:MAG: error-prone DNA polymerase [Rhodospirillales bacterium CG15_BIG_FIL_POST_REV_8_21_14_020_66_15]|nr:MAG: error-prone DNA polymerase [Rhodospirillales bacterium CG15_BIG_FIL_POST_REV_8_21_14_020_66_15]